VARVLWSRTETVRLVRGERDAALTCTVAVVAGVAAVASAGALCYCGPGPVEQDGDSPSRAGVLNTSIAKVVLVT